MENVLFSDSGLNINFNGRYLDFPRRCLHANLTCRYRKQLVFARLADYYNDKQKITERNDVLMAGYSGISMSNNAVEAYQVGKKPSSRITKEDILKHGITESITFF